MVVPISTPLSIWYSCGPPRIPTGPALVGTAFGVESEIPHVCRGLCALGLSGEGANGTVSRLFVLVDCPLRMSYFVLCICSCD